MLEDLGLRLLTWLDETILPDLANTLDEFAEYVVRWRELLEDAA